jgi:hypothetical protein
MTTKYDPLKPLYPLPESYDDDHAGWIMRSLEQDKIRLIPNPKFPHQVEFNRLLKLRNDQIDAAIEWVLKMDHIGDGNK